MCLTTKSPKDRMTQDRLREGVERAAQILWPLMIL